MNHTSCQFRDKFTVGGIVFYKHAFLVNHSFRIGPVTGPRSAVLDLGLRPQSNTANLGLVTGPIRNNFTLFILTQEVSTFLPNFRELKPGNILLGDQGHATLTYFCQINQVNDYLDFEAMHNLYVAPGEV